jgi:hypothetical protein
VGQPDGAVEASQEATPQEGLTMSEPKKCAHSICSCVCSDGKKYCSQMCEDSKGMTTLKCDCKHPGCTGR